MFVLEFVKDELLCQLNEKQVETSNVSPPAAPNNDVSKIRFLSVFSLLQTEVQMVNYWATHLR